VVPTHWSADQEDFLVIAGEALLIVEGEERSLRQWDLVHCPPGTEHTIVGAGETAYVVVAVGAPDRSTGADWAHTRRMKPRVATTPGSSERRTIPSTPIRDSAPQSERDTGTAGSPAETGDSTSPAQTFTNAPEPVSEEAARAASSALAMVDTAERLLDRDLKASDYAGVAASGE
jgi:Cupin domain